MKTNISFWLKEKNIFSLYDLNDNPFNVGMKFWVNIEDIYPKTISDWRKEYNEEFVKFIISSNDDKIKQLNNERFKVIKIDNTLKININNENCIKIDCYVKKSNPIYWEWWYFKSVIRKFFNKK